MFRYGEKVRVKATGQVGVVDAVFGGEPPAYALKGISPAKPYYEEDELEGAPVTEEEAERELKEAEELIRKLGA